MHYMLHLHQQLSLGKDTTPLWKEVKPTSLEYPNNQLSLQTHAPSRHGGIPDPACWHTEPDEDDYTHHIGNDRDQRDRVEKVSLCLCPCLAHHPQQEENHRDLACCCADHREVGRDDGVLEGLDTVFRVWYRLVMHSQAMLDTL